MAYHIVTAGSCWMGAEGEEQVLLQPGEAIVFPHGDAHYASGQRANRADFARYNAAPMRPLETVRLGGGSRARASLVCGYLGCDARPYNPLLSALPRSMHVRGITGGWLGEFPRQVVAEAWQTRAGGSTMLTRMAELMFVEVVRRYTEELSPRRSCAASARVDAGGAGARRGDVAHGAGQAVLGDRGSATDAVPRGVAPSAGRRAAGHQLAEGGGGGRGGGLRVGGGIQPGVQAEDGARAGGVAAAQAGALGAMNQAHGRACWRSIPA